MEDTMATQNPKSVFSGFRPDVPVSAGGKPAAPPPVAEGSPGPGAISEVLETRRMFDTAT